MLLTKERVTEIRAKMDSDILGRKVTLLDSHISPLELALLKAQVQEVWEWGESLCRDHNLFGAMPQSKRECKECWQSLKMEE